jgi:hypothetical protein
MNKTAEKSEHHSEKKLFAPPIVLGIIAMGLVLRLAVAFHTRDCYRDWRQTGFHDIRAWVTAGGMVIDGVNPYAESYILDFAPGWAWISAVPVSVAGKLGLGSIGASLLVKFLLSLADVFLAYMVYKISSQVGRPAVLPVSLVALNPVSILTTGYQGQFDNVTLLPITFWILLLLRWKQRNSGVDSVARAGISGGLVGLSMTMKHSSGPLVLFLADWYRSWRYLALSLLVAVLLFTVAFLPYVEGAGIPEIYRDVFGQQQRNAGTFWATLAGWLGLEQPGNGLQKALWIFMVLLSAAIAKKKHMGILATATFYYITIVLFAPSIARHYFVYPLVFGAIAFPFEMAAYSAAVSLLLLSSPRSAGQFCLFGSVMDIWPVFLVLLLWWLRIALPDRLTRRAARARWSP